MAASIFTGLSNLRQILSTETDADSPITETLMNAIRYMGECLQILTYSTGDTGTATTVGTTTLTDTGQAWSVDEHNGRTLLVTSGNAVGNCYTIDDTTATTVVCTGDDLTSDGMVVGDTYGVFYDLITHASGHTHDAVDSASVVLPAGSLVIAYSDSNTDAKTTSATSPALVAYGRCYLPSNISSMQFRASIRLKIDNATYVSRGKFQITDAGSTTVTSSEVSTSSTSPIWKDDAIVSGATLVTGWAEITVQHYVNNASGTSTSTGYYIHLEPL